MLSDRGVNLFQEADEYLSGVKVTREYGAVTNPSNSVFVFGKHRLGSGSVN